MPVLMKKSGGTHASTTPEILPLFIFYFLLFTPAQPLPFPSRSWRLRGESIPQKFA
jgi:hypothetical protein